MGFSPKQKKTELGGKESAGTSRRIVPGGPFPEKRREVVKKKQKKRSEGA